MALQIKGFLENSLIDWEGEITSIIWLDKCNFHCPFCDNGILIEAPEELPTTDFKEIKDFLLSHKGWIDGVVITGGEPTLHQDLPDLIQKIKDLGFLIKLDTNGTNPQMVADLIKDKMIDYVAMDLKAPLDERYYKAVGKKINLQTIQASIDLLMEKKVAYEFRSTVVPTLLNKKDIEEMGALIKGAPLWALQQFVPDQALEEDFRKVKPYQKDIFYEMKTLAEKYVQKCLIRGIG